MLDNAALFGESDLSEDEKKPEGQDQESSGEYDKEDLEAKSLFVNPLVKKPGKAEESEEWDDDLSEGTRKSK